MPRFFASSAVIGRTKTVPPFAAYLRKAGRSASLPATAMLPAATSGDHAALPSCSAAAISFCAASSPAAESGFVSPDVLPTSFSSRTANSVAAGSLPAFAVNSNVEYQIAPFPCRIRSNAEYARSNSQPASDSNPVTPGVSSATEAIAWVFVHFGAR